MSKDVDVELPWRHVIAFLSKAETVYSFSTTLSPILRSFLKSTNLK